MAISAKEVMALRKKSGLGMMECKQALEESGGDAAAAEQVLRQRGLAKMDSRAGRESAEGRIGVAISNDRVKGAIVEINTETDFTASNPTFKQMVATIATEALSQEIGEVQASAAIVAAVDELRLTTKENVQFKRGTVIGGAGSKLGAYAHHNGRLGALVEVDGDIPDQLLSDLCMHVVGATPTPLGIVDQDISDQIVEEERKIARAQALESGKPENIVEKIIEGKMRKFFEQNTLLKQPFVKDDKKQVKDILPKGVTIKSFVRFELGGV